MTRKAECARCGKLRTIISRGLCWKCRQEEIAAGTIDQNYPSKRPGSGKRARRPGRKDYIKAPANFGICPECDDGEEQPLVPDSGLCIKCHAEKLKQDLGLDAPATPERARPVEKISAQAVFDYIQALEAKVENSERAYRKLRRSVLASLSAAQDDLLQQEGLIEAAAGRSFMKHHKPSGDVEIIPVPDESLEPSPVGPIRTEED